MAQAAREIAARFAAALDAEDYPMAQALLAEDCTYETGQAPLAGPAAIIESYRVNGESARQRFDRVDYTSSVAAVCEAGAVITFSDRLQLAGQRHEFRCRQHVHVNPAGLIEHIRHEELPSERQRLSEFEGGASPNPTLGNE